MTRNGKKATGLKLQCTGAGRNGNATVVAYQGEDIVAVEELNLTKSRTRANFIKQLCEQQPGVDPKALEAKLLRLATASANQPESKGGASVDPAALTEVDTSRIVRPERFITPEVSGLAVPAMVAVQNRVVGQWLLYLRWGDGRRECRGLASTIDLPSKERLWITPEPCEPTADIKQGWSKAARSRWLDGEPAPDPAAVFQGLCQQIAHFLHLPKSEAPGVTATLACWILVTYCYQVWPAVPYLYIGGPLGSGKSHVFDVLARLVFRPFTSSSVTAPTLFRTLHTAGVTPLLDEAEKLKQAHLPEVQEIVSMLLAGYRQGGTATRLEPVGENGFRTRSFDVFRPKALACIAGLPPALASRCIPVTMFRAPPKSPKPKQRIDANPAGWQRLRDELHALALEHGPDFLAMSHSIGVCPPDIDGRAYELWQPLLALAAWIEQHGAQGLQGLLQRHALATIDAGRNDQTPDCDEILLRLLAKAIKSGERPEPGELLRSAQDEEPAAFKNWSARAVTSHLTRYRVPTPKKCAGRRVFGT